MFKTKAFIPYERVKFHIWLLEKLCGRTLNEKGVKIATQAVEKEEMVPIDENCFEIYGYKVLIHVAVVVAIVVIFLSLVIYYSTKYNAYPFLTSVPVLVLMFVFFNNLLPDLIRKDINFLRAKEWEKFRSGCKKVLDEYKNLN
ncbi:MAG: hypothetical protein PHT31_06985 [Candidatus Omnitrophica bacterium]|nr:hypothetical protein [Candidatus Omnitrophota bacterium]